MKRQLLLTVRGKTGEWGFTIYADPALLEEWRADGLEIYECVATVPFWAAAAGLAPLWVAVQRAWQWLRVW